jgi:hypothetical protein
VPHNIAALFMRLVGSTQERLGRGSCNREKKQEGHAVRPRLSGKWWPQKKHDQRPGLEELNAVHVLASDFVLIVGSRRMHPITCEKSSEIELYFQHTSCYLHTCRLQLLICCNAETNSDPAARDCRYQQECVCTYLQLSIKSILDLHFYSMWIRYEKLVHC